MKQNKPIFFIVGSVLLILCGFLKDFSSAYLSEVAIICTTDPNSCSDISQKIVSLLRAFNKVPDENSSISSTPSQEPLTETNYAQPQIVVAEPATSAPMTPESEGIVPPARAPYQKCLEDPVTSAEEFMDIHYWCINEALIRRPDETLMGGIYDKRLSEDFKVNAGYIGSEGRQKYIDEWMSYSSLDILNLENITETTFEVLLVRDNLNGSEKKDYCFEVAQDPQNQGYWQINKISDLCH